MKLSFEQIKSVTLGAVRVENMSDGINFFRFTKEQEELYKERNEDFYNKTFATSGIQLRFITNSKTLSVKFTVTNHSSRKYFSLEIMKNGEKFAEIKNFDEEQLPTNYTTLLLDGGEFSKEIELGNGEKEISIVFPWSMNTVIRELSLGDGASLIPVKPAKKLLAFGDSITQGYDALYPSDKYITRLAKHLGAEEFNKAIGGEVFFPELAKTREDFIPDIITVAYGTNDWSKCSKEDFVKNCAEFYRGLSENYKGVKTYAITPIWRKDKCEYRKFGEFSEVEKLIGEITAEYDNITVISGADFVPANEEFYADAYLHPNDNGFRYYAENIIKEVGLFR